MDEPATCLAKRLSRKLQLAPPVAIEDVVELHADLVKAQIPIPGVDGVSLNVKSTRHRPRVVVNVDNPLTRLRFTLAHELGHIIIPWHVGTIVDSIDAPDGAADNAYIQMEMEANAFAAELLMPKAWIQDQVERTVDLAQVHSFISTQCGTSLWASSISLVNALSGNVVFAVFNNGVVEYSGRTEAAIAPRLARGTPYEPNLYPVADSHFFVTHNARSLHWWIFPEQLVLPTSDERGWRAILEDILNDLEERPEDWKHMQQAINGVIASANSLAKRRSNYSPEAIVAVAMQRFHGREKYEPYLDHPSFASFVVSRAKSFFA